MAQAQRKQQDEGRGGRERPAFDPKYGVSEAEWAVLCDAIFPGAKTAAAIGMALEYCRVRKLDIFKRPVHIVPVWSTAQGRMIESVWPGISELRTTAARTQSYAGIGATTFGDMESEEFVQTYEDEQRQVQTRTLTINYPSWAQVTVWKIVSGVRCEFVGPKVYWKEIYASVRASKLPNDRWQRAPSGQLEKCAEAAALRRAFPEEIGNELSAEEMEGRTIDLEVGESAPRPRLVAPSSEEVSRRALTHQPAEVVDTKVEQPKTKEPVEAQRTAQTQKPAAKQETIKVPESRQGRQPLPKEQPQEQPSLAIEDEIDPAKWLDDVCARMRQAKTPELLKEVWEIDCEPRKDDVMPPDFTEARDCYNECAEKFGA